MLGGDRLLKSDMRIQAYGTVDELNSFIGLLSDQEVNKERGPILRDIQNQLFTMGAHLAAGSKQDRSKLPGFRQEYIASLEQAIDLMDGKLPQLKSFILPGGHQSVSYCHIARCVCRRAERHVISVTETSEVDPVIIAYLNRLSDYLFVLARSMALELGVQEIPWKGNF